MASLKIPYESLDPLTIGASGDESKVYREELELEVPDANLLAAIYPDEPEPVADATEAARAALESPVSGPALLRAPRLGDEGRGRHRQPVPADAAVAAAAGGPRRDRGGGQAGGGRVRERQGLPDVRVGHRAEDRPREPRPDGAARDPVPPERAAERRRVHLRRRLLARHAGVADDRGRRVRPEDHDRPGAVEPLGRGRRRQADPARASSPTRRSSRTTARSSPRRRPTTAPTPARCARTSTRWRRCAASSAR